MLDIDIVATTVVAVLVVVLVVYIVLVVALAVAAIVVAYNCCCCCCCCSLQIHVAPRHQQFIASWCFGVLSESSWSFAVCLYFRFLSTTVYVYSRVQCSMV